MSKALTFKKKVKRPKQVQVRFWSTPGLYEQFVAEVYKNDLLIQDVFKSFMEWFIQAKDKEIK